MDRSLKQSFLGPKWAKKAMTLDEIGKSIVNIGQIKAKFSATFSDLT